MRSKTLEEEDLAKEAWWWRPGAKNHPENFNQSNSLAFNYELVRREYRREKFQPFPAVASLCRFVVPELDETPVQEQICRFGSTEESGWAVLPSLQWNLRASDSDLAAEFVSFIQRERQLQNVVVKQEKRKRTRPLSWSWLELMDIRYFRIRLLDDNERSSLSTARKKAKENARIFSAAVNRYLQYQRESPQFSSPKAFYGWSPDPAPPSPMKVWHGVWPTDRKNKLSARPGKT